MRNTNKKSYGHWYECEQCEQMKRCKIIGCKGDCIKLCIKCVRKK